MNTTNCSIDLNKNNIDKIKNSLPNDDKTIMLSEVFKVFGDSTRIKIILALMDNELCVCDLVTIVGVSQSAISHQLRILRTYCLVKTRREGKNIFYSLDDDHVVTIVKQGLEHINHKHID